MQLILVIIVAFFMFKACSSYDDYKKKTGQVKGIEEDSKIVDEKTKELKIEPYNQNIDKKTLKSIGGRNDDATKLRIMAAKSAAQDKRCDKVEMSEASMTKSTKDNISLFVDCTNGKRFITDEERLNAGKPALTKEEYLDSIGVSTGDALILCSDEIKKSTKNYSNLEIHDIAGYAANKYDDGSVTVTINFEFQNYFGATVPKHAQCKFDSKGKGKINIYNGSM